MIMWLRITNAQADPAKVEIVRRLYNSQELTDFFRSQKGHRFHYLLESSTEPGAIIFLTAWDSQEEMEAAYASDAHKEVGGKFKQYLVAPSEKHIYEVFE
jgi:quinol monooxygenase YgiN